MLKKLFLILFLSTMIFGYTPTPAPVVPPGRPPQFDPNAAPSPVMGYFVVYTGQVKNGQFDIVEPDGEIVTIQTDTITMGTHTSAVDTNDPNGIAMKYTYDWSYRPAAIDVGTHYVNVIAIDTQGNPAARTIVLIVKQNAAPVFTGCR